MDFSQYTVDAVGNVYLSDDLNAWMLTSSWRRHGLYHRICQDVYRARNGSPPPPPPGGNDLRDRGLCLLPDLLAAEECAAMRQSIDGYIEGQYREPKARKRDSFIVPWSHYRAGILRRVLPNLLSPDVTAMVEDYYGCHFQVMSVSVNRYLSSTAQDVSFKWHRDYEPPQQLHLMVYLSGASDGGGRTEILDQAATRRAAEKGYSYPKVVNRTDDLTQILDGPSADGAVVAPDLEPGGALIFAGPRNLHRGVKPRTGGRDTLLILLIPSPLPWRARLDVNFRRSLTNGVHTTCCVLNPFGEFSEATEAQHGLAPEWAMLGEMFPPGDSGY